VCVAKVEEAAAAVVCGLVLLSSISRQVPYGRAVLIGFLEFG